MHTWQATRIFHTYLDELIEIARHCVLMKEVRAAVYQNLNWETLAATDAKGPIQTLLDGAKDLVVEHANRSLFLSAHAGFEQYVRDLLADASSSISAANAPPAKIPLDATLLESLRKHQIQLAGQSFSRVFKPLAHLKVDSVKVARAIAQSSEDDQPFLLESCVFGFGIGNIDETTLESIFGRFDCKIPWDAFARKAEIRQLFSTKKQRETENAVFDLFHDMLEKRNHAAHSQGSLSISIQELEFQHIFLKELSQFLHATLAGRLPRSLVQAKAAKK